MIFHGVQIPDPSGSAHEASSAKHSLKAMGFAKLNTSTKDGQKVLGPLYCVLPGNENLTITFQYNLEGNVLSPSLFELSYPFKIEGLFVVPQVLIYWLYDAFIASILGLQFWESIEVRSSHVLGIWGMRKDFNSTFSRSSHGNL